MKTKIASKDTVETSSSAKKKSRSKEDIPKKFDQFKDFNGRLYTGMQIGRGHHWDYENGDWKETKITPDLWEISYQATKRRKGRGAPQGSGVPVDTEYHWYILAHQSAKKLNANDYSTYMTGLKFKLAHKRADKERWSRTAPTQRKHLIKFLKDFISQLEKDPVPIDFEYEGKTYKGEGIPITETCQNGVCYELAITLNDESLGIIRCAKSGWKMDNVDQGLTNAIGDQVFRYFE